MYEIDKIQECLFGLIGFQQPVDPSLPTLAASLTTSTTGLLYNNYHALITVENLYASSDNFDSYDYSNYDNATEYNPGDRVIYETVAYQCIQTGTGQIDNREFFRSLFGLWLESKVNNSINKSVNRLITKRQVQEINKSILKDVRIYNGTGNFSNKIVKSDRFVGFQITPKTNYNIRAVIRKIGTQFTEAQGPFNLYLFHSSQLDPISTISLNLSKAISFEWSNVTDVILKYMDEGHNSGGSYVLGYYEEDLLGQAIERTNNVVALPDCGSCNQLDYIWHKQWQKYLGIIPIEVNAGNYTKQQMFDLSDAQSNYGTNYGLNLEWAVYCDLTDLFCGNTDLFVEIVGYQVAADLLEQMAYSIRDNLGKEIQSKAKIALDESDNELSVRNQLEKKIEGLEYNLSDLDPVCMPCNTPKGIKYGAV